LEFKFPKKSRLLLT
jgi:hypothetical protein